MMPRCETCRFWERSPDPQGYEEDLDEGECTNDDVTAQIYGRYINLAIGDELFLTNENFGCVRHEPRRK